MTVIIVEPPIETGRSEVEKMSANYVYLDGIIA